MSPIVVNGHELGVEHNGVFTDANTDPIPGGKLWPQAAAQWLWMRHDAIVAGVPAAEFEPVGPRASARTLDAQRYFYAHQPPAAAYPGTSNHGWGIAVDVKTRRAAAWLMANCAKYGWSHDEGARVGEWWHYRLVRIVTPPKRDALGFLLRDERRWAREYDRLLRLHSSPGRRRELRRVMERRRRDIWHEAQRSGWDRRNRRKRYRSLLARTT